jgi:DNA invertase Pin-like site-specific DNA recombinase
MRAAIYLRVSTLDQTTANQAHDVRQFVMARGWSAVEYADEGVSGAKERRPALDRLLVDARRRKFDVLVVWRLDRLGRNLRHLVNLIDEFQALGVGFVSLGEGIDATTSAGRLQLAMVGAFAQFERERIGERVRASLARLKAEGKRLGRPRADGKRLGVTVRAAALLWACSPATAARRLRRGQLPVTQTLTDRVEVSPDDSGLPMAAAGADTTV